jgi:Sec7-like guanine-nucleotide exchange factor
MVQLPVQDKVTVEQFIKRNQGIEGGNLLSPTSMISMYNSIQTEPFRFPEEDGNDLMLTFFNPDYEGTFRPENHLFRFIV